MLSEKRAKSKTTVEKNLYKLLANSTYGKFVETGLKRMKVKFANTWNEREAIIQKHGYDIIARTTIYSENLVGIKLGRQRAHTGVRSLPIEEHTVKEKLFLLWIVGHKMVEKVFALFAPFTNL